MSYHPCFQKTSRAQSLLGVCTAVNWSGPLSSHLPTAITSLLLPSHFFLHTSARVTLLCVQLCHVSTRTLQRAFHLTGSKKPMSSWMASQAAVIWPSWSVQPPWPLLLWNGSHAGLVALPWLCQTCTHWSCSLIFLTHSFTTGRSLLKYHLFMEPSLATQFNTANHPI